MSYNMLFLFFLLKELICCRLIMSDSKENKELSSKVLNKKKYYHHKFNQNLKNRFSWLKSEENNSFCGICKTKLVGSLTHLKRHEQSHKHKTAYQTAKTCTNIETFIENDSTISLHKNVCSAELKLVMFLHEHNLPFSLMDHLSKLICSICPDSNIAKNINCSRTKATAITNECLAKEQLDSFQRTAKENCYYSIIIDETTDVSTKKCLAVIIRFFSEDKIRDNFLGLVQVQSTTAETLFNAVKNLLIENKISTQNILGFAADNAAVMMGQKSSVLTRFKELNKDIYAIGCICHSLHLCSSKATTKLPKSVEEFVRNLYNHFANSPKRVDNFEEYQRFLDLKPYKVLRPSQTRWLSLQMVVDRVLLLWDSFILYFTNTIFEEDRLHTTSAILDHLRNPVFKIYLLFLSYILDIINKLNLVFQGEGTQVHMLHTRFTNLYKTVLRNFIKKSLIDKTDLSKISPTNPDYYLKVEDVYMGAKVQLFLNNHSVRQEELNKIRINILNFYVELCEQIKKRYDFDDKRLIFLTNFQPKVALSGNVSSIVQAAELFKSLVTDIEALNTEWRRLPDMEYLKTFENALFDEFWLEVFHVKNELNEEMFPNLNKFVKGIMCLPHTSASVERIFSQLNLIKTDVRNKLDIKTCNSIILAKQLMGSKNCYTWEPSSTLMKKKVKY